MVCDKARPIAAVFLLAQKLTLCPPIGKKKRYDPIEVTVIHAREENKASDGEAIDWKLVTDLPVAHLEDAVEKLK